MCFTLLYSQIVIARVLTTLFSFVEQSATSKPIRLTMKGFSLAHKEEKRYSDLEWKIFDQYQTGRMNQYVLNPMHSTPTSLPLHFYFGYQMVEEYNMMEQYGPVSCTHYTLNRFVRNYDNHLFK